MTHTNGTREQQRKQGKHSPCSSEWTNPQATEDGQTWPKDTSVPTAKTTILAQQVTQAHPQIGMDAGERKNAQLAEENVTTQETAELNGTMNFGAPGAIETITATTLAD